MRVLDNIMRKNGKSIYIVAFALLLGGLGHLAATGITAGTVLHVQVSEALRIDRGNARAVSVTGSVSLDGISALRETEGIRFQIQDHKFPDKRLWAVYYGDIPDLFAPGAPVILEGAFQNPGQDFKVSRLITLCPAKYEEKAAAASQS
ncbi:MAG: cytochrome c maturation protein CcmE [Deltaproteobacteria bacterium]|nr:cytochrome c maturation protein CcmE [Deltaproteobacteria bacterium]